MPDEIQKEILDRLESLNLNLGLYLNLFKLVNADKIAEMKQNMLKPELRRQIYDLCDEPKSAKEIAKELNIRPQNVRYHLNELTLIGLLFYKQDGRERRYFKTLE
ncbi:MAG: winged helix-turn-helix domain-containing protein [Methanocellales archaeon]|nr:winged helix-turn-helix domain-containing protein [Methanocellales archaeon]MDD3291036.1 winged helix-turn-helix domain-containing protein [Methanocellales archaeon]MDD5234921.1 winged helix-turn-helix domain-containing protein [Methanocellales archaeon]MDD5484709.1 winged helix-turn-helix domain-containing protein [Methanocellales archaeon]